MDRKSLINEVLENQLFAPALKGVIDFDFVELVTLSVTRFFAPFRVGADEENQNYVSK
jgi:hypothetical protein